MDKAAQNTGDDVTALLAQWRIGSPDVEERLMRAVHGELRRLAASHLRRERRGHTLQPTALVHEAYMRLVGQRRVDWRNRAHFFGIATRMMRRILVDRARRRAAAKRAGFSGERVTLSGIADPIGGGNIDVLNLHEALTRLAVVDPRQASVVELRYFGGLTADEIGAALTISSTTVKRELATAKLWLRREMVRVDGGSPVRPRA